VFLQRALLPLHKPKCVALYHQQLSYCVTQFVEKDPKLADLVLRGLLKCAPLARRLAAPPGRLGAALAPFALAPRFWASARPGLLAGPTAALLRTAA
jgi:hypothetical protein